MSPLIASARIGGKQRQLSGQAYQIHDHDEADRVEFRADFLPIPDLIITGWGVPSSVAANHSVAFPMVAAAEK
jgi:hypothetical protein